MGENPKTARRAVKLTEIAQEKVKAMLDRRGKPSAGIRVGVRSKGCSGFSYSLEYADTIEEGDEKASFEGFDVLIDAKALMFVLGTEMDWVEEPMKSGFVFRNPNEAGRCGCGESFRV